MDQQPDIMIDSAEGQSDSKIGRISIRGIIALMLVLTVCIMAFLGVEVKEPLYSMALLALGFYFGQKGTQK